MRRWLPWVVLLGVGWAAVALYSYPGFMSFDSVEQLAQARGLAPYTDWHPPAMSFLWKLLELVATGPFPMLLLQCGLLLAGMYAIFVRVFRPWTAVAVALAIFLWPPMFTTMAVIWKDSLMAGVAVSSFAALTSSRPRIQIASLAGFLFATMLRHNAIFAVAPMLILLSPWPAARGRWVRRACGLAIAIALLVAGRLGNAALTDVKTYPFHNSLAVYDLAGVIRYSDPLTDAECEEILAGIPLATHEQIQERARHAFSPYAWFPVVWGDQRLMDPPQTDAQRDAVMAAWLRVVTQHTGAYLRTRMRLFREVLGFTLRRSPTLQIYNALAEDPPLLASYGILNNRGSVQVAMSAWLADVSTTSAVFRAYPYVLLALVLLVVMWSRRDMQALLLGAFAYELTLFVVAPSPDFRYSHWLATCALIAFAVHVGRAIQRARSV